ncbi:hypothetical protein HYV86_04750 [Candidatus Woesearchaeota archaeon]|nr:hypothetical protein [Candidatus Woesearchaeota archaeon]
MRIAEFIFGLNKSAEKKYIDAEIGIGYWLDQHKVKAKPKASIMSVLRKNKEEFSAKNHEEFAEKLTLKLMEVIAALEVRGEVIILTNGKNSRKIKTELETILLRALA